MFMLFEKVWWIVPLLMPRLRPGATIPGYLHSEECPMAQRGLRDFTAQRNYGVGMKKRERRVVEGGYKR